jgi:Carboxypeptidase regulatory-like domain
MVRKITVPAAKLTIIVKMATIATMVVALVIIGSAQAMPQQHISTLEGLVLGPDNKPVANASVTYQSGGGNAPHVVRTDAEGRFSVKKLRADIYDVRASAQGVYSDWKKNVNLRPGQTTTLTLRLTHAMETPTAAPTPQP